MNAALHLVIDYFQINGSPIERLYAVQWGISHWSHCVDSIVNKINITKNSIYPTYSKKAVIYLFG